ncbi:MULTISPECIES: Cof-type HAD-IIB family hydrolase [unclassified Butyrivibrio]|uniref:Cof-type HAD-IIB family hydrolase n=1 Tax=unclassified Butyrivibrio TaxID=2639466 RepID=UPI0004085117|nr:MULTISPECIES: Cof-type HAD-IIB family hydrolase [unclassified Butyrivibrio]
MVLFFDIDGTLWNYKNEINEKTIEGIRQARANGHKCFINTGRARAFITNENLLGIGFDGIVSACGTMIEFGDEVIYQRFIPKEDAIRTIETVREYGFKPILEGPTHLYLELKDFQGDMYGDKIIAEMGSHLRGIDECYGNWEMNKLSCATEIPVEKRDECFDKLSDLYDYIIHSDTVVEMVPKGFNKGTGIEKVCDLLGESIENTFAFGDSINDKEMLLAAGVGVGMGETYHDLTDYADYITTSLDNDGIWNALKHFELI